MKASRTPDFVNKTREGMGCWFVEMALRGLLFHPEDRPRDIVTIATGRPAFTRRECAKLDCILADMFESFGEGVCEAAYPIFMKQFGRRVTA